MIITSTLPAKSLRLQVPPRSRLNSLPEVKELLKTDFDSREISEQNLSDWKAHGYLDWQGQQKALAVASELKAKAAELAAASDGELIESLATIVAVQYAAALDGWNSDMTDEMRVKLRGLKAISREVMRVCRTGQTLQQTKIQREWLALGSKAADLNERRYKDAKREQEVQALAICTDEARKFPDVQTLFRQAFEALKTAKNAK